MGAGWRPQQDEARRGVREGRLIPLSRVIDQIRSRAPGRQLDAGIETDAYGRSVYRVRWAGADGRRSDYIVDAETGRILGVDGR
ncbi:MAG: PepSY domain-containing protein [Thermoleophilia bacterium]|nr:PepSY domain-containing protein [Thermoleophilia bacterium]